MSEVFLRNADIDMIGGDGFVYANLNLAIPYALYKQNSRQPTGRQIDINDFYRSDSLVSIGACGQFIYTGLIVKENRYIAISSKLHFIAMSLSLSILGYSVCYAFIKIYARALGRFRTIKRQCTICGYYLGDMSACPECGGVV